jgi:hypothetical protein
MVYACGSDIRCVYVGASCCHFSGTSSRIGRNVRTHRFPSTMQTLAQCTHVHKHTDHDEHHAAKNGEELRNENKTARHHRASKCQYFVLESHVTISSEVLSPPLFSFMLASNISCELTAETR